MKLINITKSIINKLINIAKGIITKLITYWTIGYPLLVALNPLVVLVGHLGLPSLTSTHGLINNNRLLSNTLFIKSFFLAEINAFEQNQIQPIA